MKRIIFHGTSQVFSSFHTSLAVKTSEPNSNLGTHTTRSPKDAVAYANKAMEMDHRPQKPVVLILEHKMENVYEIDEDRYFYGWEELMSGASGYFADMREELVGDGFDSINFRGSHEDVITLLKEEDINILGVLEPSEAIALSEKMDIEKITWDEPERIIEAWKSLAI